MFGFHWNASGCELWNAVGASANAVTFLFKANRQCVCVMLLHSFVLLPADWALYDFSHFVVLLPFLFWGHTARLLNNTLYTQTASWLPGYKMPFGLSPQWRCLFTNECGEFQFANCTGKQRPPYTIVVHYIYIYIVGYGYPTVFIKVNLSGVLNIFLMVFDSLCSVEILLCVTAGCMLGLHTATDGRIPFRPPFAWRFGRDKWKGSVWSLGAPNRGTHQ